MGLRPLGVCVGVVCITNCPMFLGGRLRNKNWAGGGRGWGGGRRKMTDLPKHCPAPPPPG